MCLNASHFCRAARVDPDHGLGISGLRRIRRQGPFLRTPTLIHEEDEFVPSSLQHTKTLPSSMISSSSPRSVSAGYLTSGPSSPVIEDLHRFPSESLHSFSFAHQSEEFLHSRQNILRKSIDFMRDRSSWAANPALAAAQARLSGDAEIQGMMDLLKKANMISVDDTHERKSRGLATGPMTGPADVDGPNIFEKSFSQEIERPSIEEPVASPPPEQEEFSRCSTSTLGEGDLELPRRRPTGSASPSAPGRLGLKRTFTDLTSMSLEQRLMEALAQPYSANEPLFAQNVVGSPVASDMTATAAAAAAANASSVHTHSSKWSPAHQAVFRTEADLPWTILAANDLACLIFGVTRAEVRSLSILGIIQEERRQWLETKLARSHPPSRENSKPSSTSVMANGTSALVGNRSGITARILSKAPSRANKSSEKAQTSDGSGGRGPGRPDAKNHPSTKSRGVLLCGDIVPIQKRDGSVGAASFWVMEKRGGLIWVIEEITEDVAYLPVDSTGTVSGAHGDLEPIWGRAIPDGTPLKTLIPRFPFQDFLHARVYGDKSLLGHFTVQTANGSNVPATVEKTPGKSELRISSLPHIAGVMVLNPETLCIISSNSVFSAALFGYEQPDGLPICDLIPGFADILGILTEEEDIELTDGIVVPEHSFRRARALLALREGKEDAASIFLHPSGLPAKHRDGADIMVDLQMRVVHSETVFPDEDHHDARSGMAVSELVYAVWITYSRQLHSAGLGLVEPDPTLSERSLSPPSQPEPPATLPSPPVMSSDASSKSAESPPLSLEAPLQPLTSDEDNANTMDEPLEHPPPHAAYIPHEKKTINDFIILEEMGSGAYGQVKLVRYKKNTSRKMVLKYVTKKRILVDTWTRDRRLGTVPLEIHVMDYLRRDGLRHPNIVEMIDFFEDDVNYYIEMLPHGIPGMDLFDYIELRSNMEEGECRNIFRQVVDAIHHLHTKAFVVHRDIKDENVVLDGEGRIKLIDFGSAAYLKNGPFDVFVGTIGESSALTHPPPACTDSNRLRGPGSAPRQGV